MERRNLLLFVIGGLIVTLGLAFFVSPLASSSPDGLEKVFAESDAVVLALPLTKETRHVIGARALRALRPSAFLMNVSRGGIVDEEALIELLRTTFDEGVTAFRKSGEAAMMKPIVQFNGEPASRLTWLNHAIAHEEYHRGQLALYARLLGRVPALTKLIMGGG